ncbi:MAG: ATP-binding protein, partial [Actinomycetota bacterium]|nr:ATP-binding protein [Actinomycetota bacterium]
MTRSLRTLPIGTRMAALTSGTLIALLFVVGLFVHRQFRDALRDDVDRDLVARARMLAQTLTIERAHSLQEDFSEDLVRAGVTRGSGLEAQLLTATGETLAATDALAANNGLVRGGALVRVDSGVPVYGDTTVRGSLYRFAAVSLEDASRRIIALAAPIEDEREAEAALLAIYVPLALVAGVLGAVAGAVIARRSLAPLRRFAAEADAIGSLDLSQRLSTPPTGDEIGRLAATLNRMLERLDGALDRERQLTAEVGHELRTPLAIIRAEVELIGDRIDDEQLHANLNTILEEIDRTTGVIDDMLLLARADAGVALDRPEAVDLGDVAEHVATRFSSVAGTRSISLSGRGEAHIQGDRRAIERALANLVDNALRHTPDGGVVEIEAAQVGDGAVLAVRDTGPGASSDALATMFDRYRRAGSRKGAAGLGLSIVAAVAASHGGSVHARNRDGGG